MMQFQYQGASKAEIWPDIPWDLELKGLDYGKVNTEMYNDERFFFFFNFYCKSPFFHRKRVSWHPAAPRQSG